VCVLVYTDSDISTGRSAIQELLPTLYKTEQTLWLSVRKRTIPTEDLSIRRSYNRYFLVEGVAWSAQWVPTADNLGLLDWIQTLYGIMKLIKLPGHNTGLLEPLMNK
jgi:hypothetical protein